MNRKPTIIHNSNEDWKGIVNLVEKAQIEINKLGLKTRSGKQLDLMALVTKKAKGGMPQENYKKALAIIERYVDIIDIQA